MTTINMQTMRYINLFDRVSRVKTSKCFLYNNVIIFAVPKEMMSRAIGPLGKNIKEIQEQLGRKIKIIKEAEGVEDASRFIEDIVQPITFKSLEVKGEEMILNVGTRNKASLIGRNKKRLEELSKIVKDYFGKELKIV